MKVDLSEIDLPFEVWKYKIISKLKVLDYNRGYGGIVVSGYIKFEDRKKSFNKINLYRRYTELYKRIVRSIDYHVTDEEFVESFLREFAILYFEDALINKYKKLRGDLDDD